MPIWFHWTGEEFVLGGPPGAPKLKALVTNSAAALTIDENAWPPKVLLVRGSASVQLLDDVSPEYAAADLHGLLACRSVRAPPAT